MKLPFTGACLCGAVKYEIDAAPIGAGNCHCRTCQKAAGAAYLPALFVPYNSLKITGAYKEYASISDSGNTIHRGFCPQCGTTLFGRNSVTDQFRPVNAATLDDPSIYQPKMDFWISDAQPWDIMNPDLPKYDENFLHF
ncbi:MAG: GFA family protein [Methylococcaceae bacterium]